MKRAKSLDDTTHVNVLHSAAIEAVIGGSTAVAVATASNGHTSVAHATAHDGEVVRSIVVNGVAFDWRSLLHR